MVRRLAVFAAVAVVVAATAAGLWFVPFVAGVAAGLLSRRGPRIVPAAALGAIAGWAATLWILALRGLPAGATARATARAIAAFAGIPPYAAVAIAVVLLLATLQTLVGAWLARALIPRRPSPATDGPGGRTDEARDVIPGPAADR